MRQASDPICVPYRLALGNPLALSIAAPAAAGPVDANLSVAPSQAAPLTASQAQTPAASETLVESGMRSVFVGGIGRPGDAEWVDDDRDPPELPMRREPTSREQTLAAAQFRSAVLARYAERILDT